MKKQCKSWLFVTLNLITIFNLLCYCSIRSMWFGIIRYTTDAVPYILLAVIALTALIHTLLSLNRKYPVAAAILFFIIDLFFLILSGTVIYFTLDASMYFIREFLYSGFYLFVISGIFWGITRLHKLSVFHKKWFPSVLLIALLVIGFFWKSDIVLFNDFDCTPVVYAVEDNYQIVFTTCAEGTGWVMIDGIEYNDTYAGYRRTEDTVHKIIVPMAALDNAGEYTIYARSMLFRGPFGAIQGKTLSKTFHWKGVNTDDGLNYYVLSDTHNTQKSPYAAGTYFGDSLDFLISCGDSASWLDREDDLTQILRLAGNITNGEVPVIFARGNHETKGEKAHEFYRYVGCDDENFYYTFRLKNIWGIVLDIGEDHGDKYAEFYDAARFNAYRRAQTAFLDEVLENAENEFNAEGVDYRIAVCHIPLTVKYTNDHAGSIKDAWLARLNKMKLTILYGGHVHQLWYIDKNFEDGTTLTLSAHYSGSETENSSRIMTNAKFPAILVSRRSDGQLLTYPEKVFDDGFIGLAVSSDGLTTTMKYTDENHEVLENITCPWYDGIDYGSEIVIENVI